AAAHADRGVGVAGEIQARACLVRRCVRRALCGQPRVGRPRIPPRDHGLGNGALLRDHLSHMNTDPIQKTVSPVDGRVYVERRLATAEEINELLRTARHAQASWRNVPLGQRAVILAKFCDEFEKRGAKIADELTWQMGRPARYAPSEVRGTLERARHMIAIAPQALEDLGAGPKPDFTRFVRRVPLGVVFTIAAWNYPYLIAVNSVVPAL